MGGLFSKKKKTPTPKEESGKKNDKVAPPAKSRVNDADKSILEIKMRMKKIKTYSDKLEIEIKA
jgi:hypothetical protein